MNIEIPEILLPIFEPMRYKILWGGRSSGKSITICLFLLLQGMQRSCKILCTREYQSSISDSIYSALVGLINVHNLHDYYHITQNSITGKQQHNQHTSFIFKGLARDINSIKSMDGIDYCFIEEAQTIKEKDWDILIPTIRKNGSEILMAFNPTDVNGYTYKEFALKDRHNALKIEINYPDNPFNSQVILDEINQLKELDYAKYEHIYLGVPLDATEDVIFKGRFKIDDLCVEYNTVDFIYKSQKVYPLYGIDFGFSSDPTAIIELFMLDNDIIYINREIYEHKLLITDYIATIEKHMPESLKKKFSCDSARPDSIAQLNYFGLNAEPALKNKGSIEAGIEYLKGKQIIINPKCKHTIYEFYNYRYKIDKNTSQITTDIIDANNHIIDSVRYGLHKQISQSRRKINVSDQLIQNISSWR